jgi:hypothetical protein
MLAPRAHAAVHMTTHQACVCTPVSAPFTHRTLAYFMPQPLPASHTARWHHASPSLCLPHTPQVSVSNEYGKTGHANYIVARVHAILQDAGNGPAADEAAEEGGAAQSVRPTPVLLQLQRWPADAWMFAEEQAAVHGKYFVAQLPDDIVKITIMGEKELRQEITTLNKYLPAVRTTPAGRGCTAVDPDVPGCVTSACCHRPAAGCWPWRWFLQQYKCAGVPGVRPHAGCR